MQIGAKLRELREAKNLSQGDIEKRTALADVSVGIAWSLGNSL
jgi:cytoskeletal protein RodZ